MRHLKSDSYAFVRLFSNEAITVAEHVVSFQDTHPTRKKGLGNNLARSCPAGIHRFLNSANFRFQIFNMIGPLLLQFSKFVCSTVYLFPVISRTRTLVGWTDILSLINTSGSIPTVKTLPGIVICQTLSRAFFISTFL